jgi:Holliday junction resolvase RusA-like endonuclease
MTITFTVFGSAQTAGSKQSFVPLDKRTKEPFRRPNGGIVVSTVDDNPKSKGWKRTVAAAARKAYRGELLKGDLAVTIYFFRPRPKSHFAKNGLSKIGRETPYPSMRPDVLKLARAVEDAITGAVWADDSQIIDEHLFKRWGDPARVEITIEPASEVQSSLFGLEKTA